MTFAKSAIPELELQNRRKRLLLLTYPFPPTGGAGVQRVTKFVKFLPRLGWDVSVLTVANPSVPVNDGSLKNDIPAQTVIRRARTWEPGYALKASVSGRESVRTQDGGRLKRFVASLARRAGMFVLQPDPQILWMPGALAQGKKLLRETHHDAILVSGPPFSTFLTAAALARFAKLPLVLDYRDEWTISNAYWENKRLDPISRYIQNQMQTRTIREARALIATTRCSAEALEALQRVAGGKAKVTWIYNGFDPQDFVSEDLTPPNDNKFRLAYVGTLWNLTSVAPLVDAVRLLAQHHPDLVADLELVFAGRRTAPQDALLKTLKGLPCSLSEYSYLDHSKAVRLMADSNALCMLLSDLPGAGRVVPAKLFEYMAARRPVLSIGPRGEAWDLLGAQPLGARFLPGDVGGIAAWLEQALRQRRNAQSTSPSVTDLSRFTREHQSGQLAELLNELVASPPLHAEGKTF